MEDDIPRIFDADGSVERTSMIQERETRFPSGLRLRGPPDEKEERAAMKSLGGVGLQRRALTFSGARPIDCRPHYRA